MKNGDYILIIAPDDYTGKKYRNRYCYEHVYVYWKNTGIIPTQEQVIHHKDENKYNNVFENLELITRINHVSHHAPRADMMKITCSFCGKSIIKEARQIRSKIKIGQKDFYCNRSCMSKHFGRGRKKK